MQLARAGLLACAAALLAAAPAGASVVRRERQSPLTRVAELLKQLRDKCEEDAKEEEALYEKFVCWGKSVVSQKTMSNAEAEAELQSLNTYISDLNSGRVELTSERVDLEKEIASLVTSLETAEAQRKQERADFQDASQELQQGVDALKEAIEVLSTATADHKEGVLLDVRSAAGHAETSDSREAAVLSRAVQLGDKFLDAGDALFLRRVLGGEVPQADWKKLNRKATFKMKYKARSTKIQTVLSKLLTIFEANLAEAQKKDADAEELYDKLVESKTKEKDAAMDALSKMASEGGAKGMAKADAIDRVQLLAAQVENDKKYINEVTKSLETKKTEYQARSALRSKEIAAISKALSILANDDSKDLFQRSLKSQGYLLLQTAEQSSSAVKAAHSAADQLRQAAAASDDARLLVLAARVGSKNEAIDKVVEAIDTMVTNLGEEQQSDDDRKETCEKQRTEDTRASILAGRAIDEASDTISTLTADIEELDNRIKQKNDELAEIAQQLASAKAQREEESARFAKDQKDDQDAADTVGQAITVMEAFYRENKLMLVQHKAKEPVEVSAGQAPPPPPKTWEEPEYGGRTKESGGILMILNMIKEDIEADKAKGKQEEADAQTMYDETKKSLETSQTDLGKQVDEMTITKGDKVTSMEDTVGERRLKKDELVGIMEKIQSVQPGCDFFLVNYKVRKAKRIVEKEGLVKAKAILQGAKFDAKDPEREIKPGDAALLVEARQHLQSLETRHDS